MPSYSYKSGITPKVPGLGSMRNASIFEGIQNALNMYLKLKDQEQQDKWKERELARQDASQGALSDYYKAQAGNLTADNERAAQEAERKRVESVLNRSAGAEIPNTDPFVGQAEKAGYPKSLTFTSKTTLPSSRFGAGMGGLPEGGQPAPVQPPDMNQQLDRVRGILSGQNAAPKMPTQGQTPLNYFQAPGEDTGMSTINIPESEKARIAAAGNVTKTNIAAENNETRRQQMAATEADRRTRLTQQQWYQHAQVELRRQGLAREAATLDLLLIKANNDVDDTEWKNRMRIYEERYKRSGIAGIIEDIGGNANSGAPPPPSLRNPPLGRTPSSAAPAGGTIKTPSGRFVVTQE